jgi:hypothetical protein
MTFLTENYVAILVALLAVSEVLALIPGIKSNSIFTLIYNFLKNFVENKQQK